MNSHVGGVGLPVALNARWAAVLALAFLLPRPAAGSEEAAEAPPPEVDSVASEEALSPQQALRRQIRRDLERVERDLAAERQQRADAARQSEAALATATERIRTLEAALEEQTAQATQWKKEVARVQTEQQAMKREMVVLKTRRQEAEAARRDKSMREELTHPADVALAWSLNDVGLLLAREGRSEEAAALYRRALALMDEGMKRTHPAVGTVWSHLAEAYAALGRLDAAEECYREAVQSFEVALGSEHPRLAAALNGWASVLRAKQALAESEEMYRRAIALYARKGLPKTMDVAAPLHNLGLMLATQERYEEAGPLLERALEVLEAYPESETARQTTVVLQTLARYYRATGDFARATACQERAAALLVKDLVKQP